MSYELGKHACIYAQVSWCLHILVIMVSLVENNCVCMYVSLFLFSSIFVSVCCYGLGIVICCSDLANLSKDLANIMKKSKEDADLKENKKQSMREIEDRTIGTGKKARNEVRSQCQMRESEL